ncbi:Hypothetical protein NTJ_02549 [Nesidiocoris tenuis]|uniref:Uncharacterized protein n=1 Tax=Nesidiocoris tenuis TaxID=355587 RepID=A0ABN7ABQ2_9HEMI|nr:Hypothetical protein NTJ_02549 [Nesidiocoris tenuis]
MVLDTSKTGLMPITVTNSCKKQSKKSKALPKLEFQNCIQPAPLTVKPFSALLNPFRKGCSIFCNHPNADNDLKLMIKKTKMKRDESREDIGVDKKALADRVGEVLEEMLSRFNNRPFDDEEDSSSLDDSATPQSRPVLVLDLMRSASQDTLSTNVGGRCTTGIQSTNASQAVSPSFTTTGKPVNKIPASPAYGSTLNKQDTEGDTATEGGAEDDADVQKRRGKVKKKKKKAAGGNLDEKSSKEVIGLVEPGETQVSAWKDGDELSWCGSSNATPLPTLEPPDRIGSSATHLNSEIFDDPTLRHLRRSLTLEQAEGEFRRIWRNVLFEALAASDKPPEVEPSEVDADVLVEPSDPDLWKSYPREFKYGSARFDIPISKATLNGMHPLEYLKNCVVVSKEYKLLYNHVFMQYREIRGSDPPWFMLGKDVLDALAQVMGRKFSAAEEEELRYLVDWKEDDRIDLRTWLGIAALSERVFGLRFSTAADPDLGERQVIEQVDFDALNDRMKSLHLDCHLKALLEAVQNVKRRRENNHG